MRPCKVMLIDAPPYNFRKNITKISDTRIFVENDNEWRFNRERVHHHYDTVNATEYSDVITMGKPLG